MAKLFDLYGEIGLRRGDKRKLQNDLQDVRGGTKKTAGSFGRLGAALKRLGPAITGAAAAWAAYRAAKASVQAAKEQVVSEARLRATLEATGYAAGYSAQQLKNMAGQFQKVTRFGDETTLSAMAMLATFKNIGHDIFPEVVERAMDIAELAEGDLQTAMRRLGQALNDPARGLTRLARNGISFTESMKDQIKALQKHGRLAEAQEIILKSLEEQVAGTAKEIGKTWVGAMKTASDSAGDTGEVIGGVLGQYLEVASEQLTGVAQGAQTTFNWMGNLITGLSEEEKQKFRQMQAHHARTMAMRRRQERAQKEHHRRWKKRMEERAQKWREREKRQGATLQRLREMSQQMGRDIEGIGGDPLDLQFQDSIRQIDEMVDALDYVPSEMQEAVDKAKELAGALREAKKAARLEEEAEAFGEELRAREAEGKRAFAQMFRRSNAALLRAAGRPQAAAEARERQRFQAQMQRLNQWEARLKEMGLSPIEVSGGKLKELRERLRVAHEARIEDIRQPEAEKPQPPKIQFQSMEQYLSSLMDAAQKRKDEQLAKQNVELRKKANQVLEDIRDGVRDFAAVGEGRR